MLTSKVAALVPAIVVATVGIEEHVSGPVSAWIGSIISIIPNSRGAEAHAEESSGAITIVRAAGETNESDHTGNQPELMHGISNYLSVVSRVGGTAMK